MTTPRHRRRAARGRRGARPRRDRGRPCGALRGHRAAHPRATRARALRPHAVHDGAPRDLVPSGDAARRRADGDLGGALLLGRRPRARPRGGTARALRVARPLRAAARAARRARPAARRLLPRARRRQPPCRPRGRRALRRRVHRQEHDAHHPHARVLGRARDARHGRRGRGHADGPAGLRLVHALHRRLPDRRPRRARRPRRDEVPRLLDADAGRDARRRHGRPRRPRLRLRHLPGRVPVEPRRREAPGRRAARRRRAAGRLAHRLAHARRPGADRGARAAVRPEERPALAPPERARRARQRRDDPATSGMSSLHSATPTTPFAPRPRVPRRGSRSARDERPRAARGRRPRAAKPGRGARRARRRAPDWSRGRPRDVA